MAMDEGGLDISNEELFTGSNMFDIPNSCSMDSFFDDIFKDTRACTHTHTCNPPGPDSSHTHTCFHVHTKIVSATSEDKDEKVSTDDTAESTEKRSKKCTVGNREAVRKYREKKKARTASLEDEIVRLSAVNQQLLKRLQGQAALEAEVARLKCLLVDIRGRIEGEIGSFPYQNAARGGNVYPHLPNPNFPGAYVQVNPCNIQLDEQEYCLHPGMEGRSGEGLEIDGQGFGDCEFEDVHCPGNMNSGFKGLRGCGSKNIASTLVPSGANKKKGGARAATAG